MSRDNRTSGDPRPTTQQVPHKGEKGKASTFKRIRACYSQEATSRRAVEREWRKQWELAVPYGLSHVKEIDAIFPRHM